MYLRLRRCRVSTPYLQQDHTASFPSQKSCNYSIWKDNSRSILAPLTCFSATRFLRAPLSLLAIIRGPTPPLSLATHKRLLLLLELPCDLQVLTPSLHTEYSTEPRRSHGSTTLSHHTNRHHCPAPRPLRRVGSAGSMLLPQRHRPQRQRRARAPPAHAPSLTTLTPPATRQKKHPCATTAPTACAR